MGTAETVAVLLTNLFGEKKYVRQRTTPPGIGGGAVGGAVLAQQHIT